MPFQLSPGVIFTETDLTLIVPTVATTSGGMVGAFQWGPANEIVTVTSEKKLVELFGTPAYDANYARYWFTAANFLKYGNNLKIVRFFNGAAGDDATATVTGNGTKLIYNEDSYLLNYATVNTTEGEFCAKYPGELGNSIKVYLLDHTPTSVSGMTDTAASDDYYDLIDNFDNVPSTSVWAEAIAGTEVYDELHVLVVDEDGLITGISGTVLEKFAFVSKASNAKNADGTSNYYVDVINNQSKYVWWLKHTTQIQSSGSKKSWGSELVDGSQEFKLIDSTSLAGDGTISENDRMVSFSLSGGKTGGISSATSIVTESDIAAAYSTFFESGQEVDVSLLLAGPLSAINSKQVIEVAEARKDCVAFVSARPTSITSVSTMTLEDALQFRTDLNISSSYGVMDSGYKLQYDNYNDRYIYIPLNADVAGTCVRTDLNQDPWFSPAGFNRGQIRNTVRLAYNPGKAERDELYKKGINPVTSFEGEGTVLFGDKTLLTRPSAFDRINVRRLFIVLEKAISTAAKYLLFEFNDEFTRAQFRQLVEPYLRNVQGRRGITDFRVVCDTSNNTPEVIDSNNFVGDIYIKPTRSINFIQLNFIATPTGVSFEEVGA